MGIDENANAIDRTVTGFHARVVQHEVDHLNGVLYPMRIRDLRQFGFSAALFPGTCPTNDQLREPALCIAATTKCCTTGSNSRRKSSSSG